MEHKEFTVHDRLGPLTITGQLLSDQRFGSGRKPRWTDMVLYRLTRTERDYSRTARSSGPDQRFVLEERRRESSFRYALEIIARSWVYHGATGPCVRERHTITTIGEVRGSPGRWKNLLPCTRCNPPDLEKMRDDEHIAEENPDAHLYLCYDARSLVKRLYRHSGEISELGAKLLNEAAMADSGIAVALRERRRI
jgi:hypothetical protein